MKIILLVEDDDDTGQMIVAALSDNVHYHVTYVSTSQEAVSVTSSTQPDLFLLDYHLPGGMNGIELYDYLHRKTGLEKVPAILISASRISETELQGRNLTFIEKPFELGHLLNVVARALS